MELVLLLFENFRPICPTIRIYWAQRLSMRVADGTDIFRPVYPTTHASPLFPHSETNFEFDFIHKTFYLSPQYKRHKVDFHCVGLRVTSYDVSRGREESNRKHDNWSFHKRFYIKRPSLQKSLNSDLAKGCTSEELGFDCKQGKIFISSPSRRNLWTYSAS